MRFKDFLKEGRDYWFLFTIKRNGVKWTFRNTENGKWNYIKIDPDNEFSSIQKFLKDINAKPGNTPKTKGDIDFHHFAQNVLDSKTYNVYVKKGMLDKIRDTWVLEGE